MKGIFRLCDYEVDELLYQHKNGEWVFYGVIDKKENCFLHIRTAKHNGIMVVRGDVLSREGFISKVNT